MMCRMFIPLPLLKNEKMKTALPYGVADLILFDYIQTVCALIKLNPRLVWLNAFYF